jgi:hypothetical protein
VLHPASPVTRKPVAHHDLSNVARWLASAVEATVRLADVHPELSEFHRAAGPLAAHDALLRDFDPSRDGAKLDQIVRAMMRDLLEHEEEDLLESEDLEELLSSRDPDWDIKGLEE